MAGNFFDSTLLVQPGMVVSAVILAVTPIRFQ